MVETRVRFSGKISNQKFIRCSFFFLDFNILFVRKIHLFIGYIYIWILNRLYLFWKFTSLEKFIYTHIFRSSTKYIFQRNTGFNEEKFAFNSHNYLRPSFFNQNSISTNRNIQILGRKRRGEKKNNRNPDNLISSVSKFEIKPLSRKRKRTYFHSNFHFSPYRSNRETTPNRRWGVGGWNKISLPQKSDLHGP